MELSAKEKGVVRALAMRTASDSATDPMTGADIGMGEAAGSESGTAAKKRK